MQQIAEVIGRGLKMPAVSLSAEEARGHFGWLSEFASRDLAASGAQTQERLQWSPNGPTLMDDLEVMRFV